MLDIMHGSGRPGLAYSDVLSIDAKQSRALVVNIRSSATAKSTARPSCYDIFRRKSVDS